MNFAHNEKLNKVDCFIEDIDSCYLCRFTDVCPLIGAIQEAVVFPSKSDIFVDGCKMFRIK
jgi:hypothetical protein